MAVKNLDKMIADYNNLNLGYKIIVPCAGSRFNSDIDSDFDGLYIRLLTELHRKELINNRYPSDDEVIMSSES